MPDLATEENHTLFNLCFDSNVPSYDVSDAAFWAKSDDGSMFHTAMMTRLAADLTPDEFILTILALLSYYRMLNWNQVFVPAKDCNEFLSGCWNPNDFGNLEQNGSLMERVAFAVIGIGASFRSAVLNVPYLRPYQLSVCMENNISTVRLDVYCSIRMSRSCSHWEAVHCINQIFRIENRT